MSKRSSSPATALPVTPYPLPPEVLQEIRTSIAELSFLSERIEDKIYECELNRSGVALDLENEAERLIWVLELLGYSRFEEQG